MFQSKFSLALSRSICNLINIIILELIWNYLHWKPIFPPLDLIWENQNIISTTWAIWTQHDITKFECRFICRSKSMLAWNRTRTIKHPMPNRIFCSPSQNNSNRKQMKTFHVLWFINIMYELYIYVLNARRTIMLIITTTQTTTNSTRLHTHLMQFSCQDVFSTIRYE